MPTLATGNNDLNKKPLLLHNAKKIFYPVGKVANSTIKNSILRCNQNTEFTTKDIILRKYMDYLGVAVVRNPFDRLVSCYTFFSQRQPQYWDRVGDIKPKDFESFIRAVYDRPDELSNAHYRSQVNLLSQDNILLPDIIVKYEEVDKITEYLPIDALVTHKPTTSEHGHYTTFYNDELRRLVAERFRADFETFGYET